MTAATDTTETAARFAESVLVIPPLPATAQKILTCFGDEFIDAVKVAEVVEGDPGICAKLLGLANSAYFGLAEPVNNMSDAISRVLGVDTVRSLVLAMAIQQSYNNRDCPSFEVDRFWMQSLTAAECCKRIVLADEVAEPADRDLAYSAGLCHNLGLMALAYMDPQRTNDVLIKHHEINKPDSLASFFIEEFDTDYKIMTAELGRTWSLPEPMVAAYQYRAFPNSICDARLSLIVAAGVAAVENAERPEEERESLALWADPLNIEAEDLQAMAFLGDRQRQCVQSLVRNITH